MGACKVCGGKYMQRPTSVKGQAGVKKTTAQKAPPGITQKTDTIFYVQGTGQKPYIVDLEGTDAAISGRPTPTCTCPNWAIERNRRHGAGTFAPDGYRCKHIENVLRENKDNGLAKRAKALSVAEAQKAADEILSTFVKKK